MIIENEDRNKIDFITHGEADCHYIIFKNIAIHFATLKWESIAILTLLSLKNASGVTGVLFIKFIHSFFPNSFIYLSTILNSNYWECTRAHYALLPSGVGEIHSTCEIKKWIFVFGIKTEGGKIHNSVFSIILISKELGNSLSDSCPVSLTNG